MKIHLFFICAADAGNAWVGAHDMIEEGMFKWLNGKTVQDIPWYPGQPGGGESQNCLAIDKAANFKFNDLVCSAKYHPLCQITFQ